MNRYLLKNEPEYETPWISAPRNGGDVGDMSDIVDELNRLKRERDELRDAVTAYRDAKGRYHTQKACERLLSLLPDNV